MMRFLLRRLAWFVLTTWVVISATFFLMRAVPGGPFDSERELNPIVKANVEARYHLDWPLWKQYVQYLGPLNLDEHGWFGDKSRIFGGLLTLDLGPSFTYRDFTVNDIIAQSFPVSVQLGVVALFWTLLLGVSAGVVAALHPRSKIDGLVRIFMALGVALPNFVIAGALILVFVFWIPIAPVAGFGTLRHMLLPGLALGLPFAAGVARLLRTSMLEVMQQDFIRAAAARGLPQRRIVWHHALRASLLPVVSYLGPATAGILTGSLVIEKIFFIPGTGSHFVNSALNRDYTLALGLTILYTILVYALNTLVDLAYTLLDPRIALE
jgi:oligopeptide transport system permease protein